MGTGITVVGVLDVVKALIVYTGTDYDAVQTGAGTTAGVYTSSTIDTTELLTKEYLVVVINYAFSNTTNTGATSRLSLKLEHKPAGGAYSTAYDDVISEASNGAVTGFGQYGNSTFTCPIDLSADEKNNGCVIKITATAYSNSAQGNAEISNVSVLAYAIK